MTTQKSAKKQKLLKGGSCFLAAAVLMTSVPETVFAGTQAVSALTDSSETVPGAEANNQDQSSGQNTDKTESGSHQQEVSQDSQNKEENEAPSSAAPSESETDTSEEGDSEASPTPELPEETLPEEESPSDPSAGEGSPEESLPSEEPEEELPGGNTEEELPEESLPGAETDEELPQESAPSESPSEEVPEAESPAEELPEETVPETLQLAEREVPDGIPVDEAHFPDEAFRKWIRSQPMGKDEILTDQELKDTTNIYMKYTDVQDLSGIEYFSSLTRLVCQNSYLESLDLSGNPDLVLVDVSSNCLTDIDLSAQSRLEELNVFDNKLTELDLSALQKLTLVNAGWNQLETIDLSHNSALQAAALNDNFLTSITLPSNGMVLPIKSIEEQWVNEEGYRLTVEWHDEDGTIFKDKIPASGQTVYSQKTPIQYKVVYYTDNRSYQKLEEQIYSYTDTVTLPQAPAGQKGYTFSGWKTSSGIVSEAGASLDGPLTSKDGATISFFGQWTGNPYRIVFHPNAPEGTSTDQPETIQEMIYGTAEALNRNPFRLIPDSQTKDEYEFVGWSLTPGTSIVRFFDGMSVSDLTAENGGTVDLYAQWRVKPVLHQVTFNEKMGNSQSRTTVQNVLENEQAQEILVGSRTGYRFKGWYTKEDLSEESKYDFSSTVNSDLTLYGGWYTQNYRVDFISDGQLYSTSSVQMDHQAELPAAPAKDGFRFAGWYENETYSGFPFDSSRIITEDTTLYAKWIPLGRYTVNFHSNGGSLTESQTVSEGGYAVEPEAPVREGFLFRGWFADSALTIPFDFGEAVHYDRSAYAKWEKDHDGESGQEEGSSDQPENGQIPDSGNSSDSSSGGSSVSGGSSSSSGSGSSSGGGGSSSGGGGGSGKGPGPADTPLTAPSVISSPLQGSWIQTEAGWTFQSSDSPSPVNAWAMIGQTWYLFDENGYMRTGWYESQDGKTYYLDGSGAMVTGWVFVNNSLYYFYPDGQMAKNTTVDGISISGSGQSLQ